MIIHCKPTYNFQSVEFDWELEDDNIEDMMVLYDRLVNMLKDIAPEQPTNTAFPKKKPSKPAEPLASERQLQYMDSLGIAYPTKCTKKEAWRLIKRATEQDDEDEIF